MDVLAKRRRLRNSQAILLGLLIAVGAVQIGPLATSASAAVYEHCTPHDYMSQTLADGRVVWWRCNSFQIANDTYWVWQYDHTDFPTEPDEYTFWRGSASSPPYLMHLEAVVAEGGGGGDMVGQVYIFNPNGSNLDRRIAVHLQVQYKPTPTSGWLSCHAGSWKEAANPQSGMKTAVAQWTQPDCGDGYYRSRVYGRFFSTSLNTWIRRGPIYTPSLFLNGPGTAPTEPTITPGTVTEPT
jgi:hypothetical protein